MEIMEKLKSHLSLKYEYNSAVGRCYSWVGTSRKADIDKAIQAQNFVKKIQLMKRKKSTKYNNYIKTNEYHVPKLAPRRNQHNQCNKS